MLLLKIESKFNKPEDYFKKYDFEIQPTNNNTKDNNNILLREYGRLIGEPITQDIINTHPLTLQKKFRTRNPNKINGLQGSLKMQIKKLRDEKSKK
jgi:hypothetical protein